MKVQRHWVTPLMAGAFLLSAVTGVLIFFHLETGANKFMHEWLGWLLLAGAGLHVLLNLGGLKAQLAQRRGQLLFGAFVVALALSFLPLGGNHEPPFMQPIRSLAQSPIATLAVVAQVSPQEMIARLGQAGVQASSEQQSVRELVGNDLEKQMHVLGRILSAGG